MSKIYPYGGFWKRLAAFLIDTFILSIPFMLVYGVWIYYVIRPVLPLMSSVSANQPLNAEVLDAMLRVYSAMSLFQIISLLVFWLYYAIMESSRYQATLGKLVLGLKVVGENGQRISFWHATGRTFAKIISAMTVYIGFLIAGANKHKQALHDIIATTYVVDKTYEEGQPLPEVETHYILLSLAILLLLFILLIPFILLGWFIAHADQFQNTPTVPPGIIEQVNTDQNANKIVIPAVTKSSYAVSKLPALRNLPPEQKQPFTENDYAFTFEDNGTVRAQHTDNDYALLMRPDENWPCCQPLVPDGCAEVTDVEVCQAK